MKNVKKIIYIVVAILVILLIVILSIILKEKKNETNVVNNTTLNSSNNTNNVTNGIANNIKEDDLSSENNTITENEESVVNYSKESEPVKNSTYFYTVKDCMDKYFEKMKNLKNKNDKKSLYNLMSENYIKSNNINVNNVENYILSDIANMDYIGIVEMRQLQVQNSNIIRFALTALFSHNDGPQYVRYILYLDYNDLTFAVEPIDNKITNLIDVKLDENINIEKNDDNSYKYNVISEKEKLNSYLDVYSKICLNFPEIAYNNYFSDEYKNLKFKTLNEFKKYVEENEEDLEALELKEFTSFVENSSYKYVCQDNMYEEYIIDEAFIMNFKIDVYKRI